jgi:hypothetical protein
MCILFGIFVVICLLFLLYDALRNASITYFARGPLQWDHPWYVHLDHWIYHCEAARKQNVLFEQHRFFGARFRFEGRPITFTKD